MCECVDICVHMQVRPLADVGGLPHSLSILYIKSGSLKVVSPIVANQLIPGILSPPSTHWNDR